MHSSKSENVTKSVCVSPGFLKGVCLMVVSGTQRCFEGVSRVLKSISRLLQKCFKDVLGFFQGCYKSVIKRCLKHVSRKFWR